MTVRDESQVTGAKDARLQQGDFVICQCFMLYERERLYMEQA